MKSKIFLASALAMMAAAASAQTTNNNGVYAAVGEHAEENSYYYGTEIFYSCDDTGSPNEKVHHSSSLKYCSASAQYKVVSLDKLCESATSTNIFSAIANQNCTAEYTYSVDDSDTGHCETGEAVVHDLKRDGNRKWKTVARDSCEQCDYTGGPCE